MQYLEFFFGNFWHFLGLAILIGIVFSPVKVIVKRKVRK